MEKMGERIDKSVHICMLGKMWLPMCNAISDFNIVLDDIGEFTRDAIEDWLGTHAGDFSSITDFYAELEETRYGYDEETQEQITRTRTTSLDWEDEENAGLYDEIAFEQV